MGAGYAETYELARPAFELRPDPRFYFSSLTQRKAMSAVSYALNRGAGMAVLTGAEGLGKSTLLAQLADQISGQPVSQAFVSGGRGAMAARVAEAFGLVPPGDESHALAAIEAYLVVEMRRGQRSLLLLDEAEALSAEAASDLAALAGMRHGERSLIQVVLAGDEDFARRLADDADWSGVREHTVASQIFEPLQGNEVEPYLRHRLARAGWSGSPSLDPGLAPLLHEATGGVPAAINRAMSLLLDQAAAAGADAVDAAGLADWLDTQAADATEEAAEPAPALAQSETASGEPALAERDLGEAQIAAIEQAFGEHERAVGKLRREVAELRERVESVPPARSTDDRLDQMEARLDQHAYALRLMLERLIEFFERPRRG